MNSWRMVQWNCIHCVWKVEKYVAWHSSHTEIHLSPSLSLSFSVLRFPFRRFSTIMQKHKIVKLHFIYFYGKQQSICVHILDIVMSNKEFPNKQPKWKLLWTRLVTYMYIYVFVYSSRHRRRHSLSTVCVLSFSNLSYEITIELQKCSPFSFWFFIKWSIVEMLHNGETKISLWMEKRMKILQGNANVLDKRILFSVCCSIISTISFCFHCRNSMNEKCEFSRDLNFGMIDHSQFKGQLPWN